MCTADGAGCALAAPGGGFASVADALRIGRALGAYLNSPAARDLDGPARGEALEQLGAIGSLLGAAANGLLRRFDADYGHDADGYANSAPRPSRRCWRPSARGGGRRTCGRPGSATATRCRRAGSCRGLFAGLRRDCRHRSPGALLLG